MKEQIIQLFKNHSREDRLTFFPEIKVRLENSIIFIYEIIVTNFVNSSPCYHVILERGIDKLRVPINLLDDISLRAIYDRLKTFKGRKNKIVF